jgi:hypothetical protein
MNDGIKLGYLLGCADRLLLSTAVDAIKTGKPLPSRTDLVGIPDLTNGETRKALDTFFATPENLNIPILTALSIIEKPDCALFGPIRASRGNADV